MKIAVACDGLVVARYYVQCTSFMIYTVERGVVTGSRNFPSFDQQVRSTARLLESLGIDALIVGRIDPDMAAVLRESGIDLVTEAADDPLVAVREYLSSVFTAEVLD